MDNKAAPNKDNRLTPYQYVDIVTVIFTLVLVISNIASSAKIIDWGISIFNIPLSFDAGTLLFPISYIFGDILTEVYGFKRARRIIWIGFISLVFSALIFWLIRNMPGEATWQAAVGQEAFDKVLGGMSHGGIVAASILGYLAGSFSNAIIMSLMKLLTKGKYLWMRTIGSTLVGELVDTSVFILVASLAGIFPWILFYSLVVTNYIFKVAVEVLMTPLTYKIVNFLKTKEAVDTFDDRKNLNPFAF